MGERVALLNPEGPPFIEVNDELLTDDNVILIVNDAETLRLDVGPLDNALEEPNPPLLRNDDGPLRPDESPLDDGAVKLLEPREVLLNGIPPGVDEVPGSEDGIIDENEVRPLELGTDELPITGDDPDRMSLDERLVGTEVDGLLVFSGVIVPGMLRIDDEELPPSLWLDETVLRDGTGEVMLPESGLVERILENDADELLLPSKLVNVAPEDQGDELVLDSEVVDPKPMDRAGELVLTDWIVDWKLEDDPKERVLTTEPVEIDSEEEPEGLLLDTMDVVDPITLGEDAAATLAKRLVDSQLEDDPTGMLERELEPA